MSMKMKHIVTFFASFFFLQLNAQEQGLPHQPTEAEKKDMPGYLEQRSFTRTIASPPPGSVRTMAEWEEVQALIITWTSHTAILREIVRHAVNECKVLIITTNPANVTTQLTNAGIPLDSVRFVNTPFNSIWVRDYGPWSVYKNDVDSLFIVDWIYNRPREQDDVTPAAIADFLDIPIYEATQDPDDLVHTGGNHLPDGLGTAFSSMLVLEENPDKTESEIDSIAKKYLGVNQYIKFPTLPYDGIHHLDMHMRLIDEETIIFGSYPDGVADGPQIDANIDYLTSEFQTSFGNPYKIIRIPMPPEGDRYPNTGGDYRTYTNSIFINKTILVPTYEEKYDTTALRIYRENLPGYNVVGINCNSIIPSLGALHCITKLVGTTDPLLIAHPRLRDSDNASNSYPVEAVIKHRSGIEKASVFYRTKGNSTYIELPLYLTDTINAIWSAVMPPQENNSKIQYYIEATSYTGKKQVRPIVAPEGYFEFDIREPVSNLSPQVSITYPEDGQSFDILQENIDITFEAIDQDGEIMEAVLFINSDSIASLQTLPFLYPWNFPGPGQYELSIRVTDDQQAQGLSQPVTILVESTTSTVHGAEDDIVVFPNPVSDVLWIRGLKTMEALAVTDLLGHSLHPPMIHQGAEQGFDFSGLPQGIYFISGIGEHTRRIIKL